MWPVERMTIMTAKPEHAALPIRVSAPLYFWFTIGAAVAPKIRMNVPTNSAPSCDYYISTGQHTSIEESKKSNPNAEIITLHVSWM